MSAVLNTSPFIPDDIREEVVALQNMVFEINTLHQNNTSFREQLVSWGNKRKELEVFITDFNMHQISRVMRNSDVSDIHQLLPLYRDVNTCIQATQKVSKGSTYNVFITYRKRVIGFSEFFRKQHKLYNGYVAFRDCFMSLAYCVYDNLRSPIDGKYVYGFAGSEDPNPYTYSTYNILIDTSIDQSMVASKTQINKYLTQIFVAICGGDIAPVTGRIVRRFIDGVFVKKSIEALIDSVFWGYLYDRTKSSMPEFDNDCTSHISRHVAWCTYRGANKECILLDQPCHASVDCAFYRKK